jgi:hypothetical protein
MFKIQTGDETQDVIRKDGTKIFTPTTLIPFIRETTAVRIRPIYEERKECESGAYEALNV